MQVLKVYPGQAVGRNIDAALRVSFCPETPAEAVDGFCEALRDAARMF